MGVSIDPGGCWCQQRINHGLYSSISIDCIPQFPSVGDKLECGWVLYTFVPCLTCEFILRSRSSSSNSMHTTVLRVALLLLVLLLLLLLLFSVYHPSTMVATTTATARQDNVMDGIYILLSLLSYFIVLYSITSTRTGRNVGSFSCVGYVLLFFFFFFFLAYSRQTTYSDSLCRSVVFPFFSSILILILSVSLVIIISIIL